MYINICFYKHLPLNFMGSFIFIYISTQVLILFFRGVIRLFDMIEKFVVGYYVVKIKLTKLVIVKALLIVLKIV